jgi:ankyrin repeat protein
MVILPLTVGLLLLATVQAQATTLSADPEQSGEQAPAPKNLDELLGEAVRSHDVAAVRSLLAKGANPNAMDFFGTMLVSAVIVDDPQIIRVLVASGAKVDLRGAVGHTPLWAASLIGKVKATETLLALGADVNAKDNDQTVAPL